MTLPDGRAVEELKVTELREELGTRGAAKIGVKAVLQQRLKEELAKEDGDDSNQNGTEELAPEENEASPQDKAGDKSPIAEVPVKSDEQKSVDKKRNRTSEPADRPSSALDAAAEAAAGGSPAAAAEDDERRAPAADSVETSDSQKNDRRVVKEGSPSVDQASASASEARDSESEADQDAVLDIPAPEALQDEDTMDSKSAAEPNSSEKTAAQNGAQPAERKERKRKWGSTATRLVKKDAVPITEDSLKSMIKDVPALDEQADEELDYEEAAHDQPAVVEEKSEKSSKNRIVLKDDLEGNNVKRPDVRRRVISRGGGGGEKEDDSATTTTTGKQIKDELALDLGLRRERAVSPSRHPVSPFVHVRCLVRPFTNRQLHDLLSSFGKYDPKTDFWVDHIKTNCIVRYATEEAATAARHTLHNAFWPDTNPKCLKVTYSDQRTFDKHVKGDEKEEPQPTPDVNRREARDKKLRLETKIDANTGMPVRTIAGPALAAAGLTGRPQTEQLQRTIDNVRDAGREWDRGKRSLDSERENERLDRRDRRPSSRERLLAGRDRYPPREEPKQLGLEDLFKKTTTLPALYWLPLTEKQIEERAAARKAGKLPAAREPSPSPPPMRRSSPDRRPPPGRSPPPRRFSPPPRRDMDRRRSPPRRRSFSRSPVRRPPPRGVSPDRRRR